MLIQFKIGIPPVSKPVQELPIIVSCRVCPSVEPNTLVKPLLRAIPAEISCPATGIALTAVVAVSYANSAT